MSRATSVGTYGGKQVFASNIVANPGTVLTLGTNDSGPIMTEARAFTEWLIQPVGTWGINAGQVEAYCFGTCDPQTSGYSGGVEGGTSGLVAATRKQWFPLVAQSQETSGDSFTWANPLLGNNSASLSTLEGYFADGTILTDSLNVKVHALVAVRIIVITAGATGTATNPNCNLIIYAIE